jgi:hypothetical protein
MTNNVSQSNAAAALLDDAPGAMRPAACPMCHTRASLTQAAVDAGGAWRCVRCGQQWDAERIEAVAAYAVWVATRNVPAERLDGPS